MNHFALGLLAWLLSLWPLLAHQLPGGNLLVLADLTEEELTYEISAETSLIPPLDDVRFEKGENFPSLPERRAALETFFREKCPVAIDGLTVAPVAKSLQFRLMEKQENLGEVTDFVMAYFLISYPTKKKPRKIDLTWAIFWPDSARKLYQPDPAAPALDPLTVDSVFYTYGKIDLIQFSPKEPQFIWHSPEPILSPSAAKRLANNGIPATKGFSLAWPTLGLVALATLVAFLKHRGFPPWWQVASLIIVAGITVALRDPLTLKGAALQATLTEAEAKQRFMDLHQNIYRAFDYQRDEEVYDTLAQSVSGDLLDRVYQEVKKSLILRDEGGAESRVKKLDYLATTLSPRDAGRAYAVDCQWRVHGLVNHWGHTHQRVNEYQATYEMKPDADAWRITGVQVRQEKQVETAPAPAK